VLWLMTFSLLEKKIFDDDMVIPEIPSVATTHSQLQQQQQVSRHARFFVDLPSKFLLFALVWLFAYSYSLM
jgi:transcriptional regulator of nitric oxide reductase